MVFVCVPCIQWTVLTQENKPGSIRDAKMTHQSFALPIPAQVALILLILHLASFKEKPNSEKEVSEVLSKTGLFILLPIIDSQNFYQFVLQDKRSDSAIIN